MSVSKHFTRTLFALIEERLVTLDFHKRKQLIFSLAVSEDVLGLVGLNTASGRGPGVLEINPVVGARSQRVERFVAELLGEPFDELNPFSAGANVGYLSPKSKYLPFILSEAAEPEGVVDQLITAIKTWGLPFIRSNASLPALLETMRSNRFAIHFQAVYRIPAALRLLGRCAEADAFLEDEVSKLGSRTDPAAERFRLFANRFNEHALLSDRVSCTNG
jgi:hypothetical protein